LEVVSDENLAQNARRLGRFFEMLMEDWFEKYPIVKLVAW